MSHKHGPRYAELEEGLDWRWSTEAGGCWIMFKGNPIKRCNNEYECRNFKEGMLLEAQLTWEKFNKLADKMGI